MGEHLTKGYLKDKLIPNSESKQELVQGWRWTQTKEHNIVAGWAYYTPQGQQQMSMAHQSDGG